MTRLTGLSKNVRKILDTTDFPAVGLTCDLVQFLLHGCSSLNRKLLFGPILQNIRPE